jgi:hypothetical protein
MRFTTEEDGKYFSLAIDNIKEDTNGQAVVTDTAINSLMDLVVQKKLFVSKTGALVGKKDAKILGSSEQSITLN